MLLQTNEKYPSNLYKLILNIYYPIIINTLKSWKEIGQKVTDPHVKVIMCCVQIHQSQNNQFNMHVHVEYEWRLRQDDLYESDDDLDDKVTA